MNLIQYFGEDCRALVVILGVGMNLVPILVTTKARIGTLFLSDLAHIMAFLSDDWEGRFLEWIQSKRISSETGFQPRCPKSREDVRALSVLHLDSCSLTGESVLFSYFPRNHTIFTLWWTSSPSPFFRCFVLTLHRANSAPNRQIDEFAATLFTVKPADRSMNSQNYPMILLYVK